MDFDGLSPEPRLVEQVRQATNLPIRVMLRLREGFGTDGGEVAHLKGLVTAYQAAGADGLVLGFLNGHTEIDVDVVTEVVAEAEPGWTFHRAVDSCISTDRAWRELRRLPGLDQVLTAGSARGVSEGLDELVRPGPRRRLRPPGRAGRRRSPPRARALAGPGRRARLPHRLLGPPARLLEGLPRPRAGRHLADPDRRAGRRRPGHRRPVTVLVDPPTWPGHGRLWSHLVSDTSYEELHAFAATIGLPRRAFERDHYDVLADRFEDVLAAGAQLVELARDRPPTARGRPPAAQALPTRPLTEAAPLPSASSGSSRGARLRAARWER